MSGKLVYGFGDGTAEGDASFKNLLGGKGANLAEMSRLGLPVPPGFTLTTDVCALYYAAGKELPFELMDAVETALSEVEHQSGHRFGDPADPLLVSVRSGARASMPGMMDTVLNLGLNDATAEGLAQITGNARFAYDSYRRFLQMYSDVVLGLEHYHFEELLEEMKRDRDAILDTELGESDLRELVALYKEKIEAELGRPFPMEPRDQLKGAIGAVFSSWMNPRAITYRSLNDIPESWGTAVTVQAMVFGNRGEDCATGVAFTRNPSTGEKAIFGEYLVNAQGEDVVAGIRTPQPLTLAAKTDELPAMEETMPAVFAQLAEVFHKLEGHYRDMQDIEFTVEGGKLWMLQTRSGKRTAAAGVRIAVELAGEGVITRQEAVTRIDPLSLDQLLHPMLDPATPRTLLTRGLPASPGAAVGKIVFSAERAEEWAKKGEAVVLVRIETSPEDIHGMHAAEGVLTARGGMTSHAAVVARGMGKPCVSGAGDLLISYGRKTLHIGGRTLNEGDIITLNGTSGEVILGAVPTIQPALSAEFAELMRWADGFRTLGVRANAETPADAEAARRFGAEGIGLCRTEHMFFDVERIAAMRQMILSETAPQREAALNLLLPMQRRDFLALFRVMEGLPVTIRLLDPPLHEFLPHSEAEMREIATSAGVEPADVERRAAALRESNPMLGHRGCRLGVTYPEIYRMQLRAIFEAAADILAQDQRTVTPEIMIPLVMSREELRLLKAEADRIAEAVMKERNLVLPYLVGTMIELPRAALLAGEIAEEAQFFSFGTNDLTQTTFGISRDDAGGFLEIYKKRGILESDPFVTLDQRGVGELVRIAVRQGRATRPELKLGICGEHGGDPASIAFCQQVGLDYVSCSPYRVPIARLAAAQAALRAAAQ